MRDYSIGGVFDDFAEAYDAHRSGYPPEVVDAALEIAGLEAGARVVEIGCGTGKLTEHLGERGLRVAAVDPGASMIDVARRRVHGSDLVEFHVGRFEELALPDATYDAVFSATAFHWVDPAVGWAKAAAVLRPGGTLALIQPVGVRGAEDGAAQDELVDAYTQLAPELAAERTSPREADAIHEGALARADNVSELWAWLVQPGHAVPEADRLFGRATLTVVPRVLEKTADEVWATFETTSRYHRLSPAVRAELELESKRIIQRHGGVLRSAQLVTLVTAQRQQSAQRR